MNDGMELLAPAGDSLALRAAVCAGADAVYLGFARFGARAAAANFDAEALEQAVAYAHLHHVRVHVTVNTLIKPGEEEALLNALRTVAASRADAVIVQDMGVLRLAREHFPALELHASTQMGIHTAAGARFAMAHGVRRVVLARECSLAQIAEVARTGMDTEAFVHGALCAGVSGQCLLSSMAGGRSGNRGRCAQPCRQPVTYGGQTAAYLSTRDLCLRDHLPQLQAAGVKALKIEGRLKSAEYVAVVTASYRKALDALAKGAFAPADERENAELLQIYQRGGFTNGHSMGAEDAALCSIKRVGHSGVPVGSITEVRGDLATAALQTVINDGDSLRVEGEQDVELRYSGLEQTSRATLRLRPDARVRVGDPVVRLTDARQMLRAQSLTEPPIPITMQVTMRVGEPLHLRVSDGETAVLTQGETAQAPRTRALTNEEIVRALSKLGDSPFMLREEPAVDAQPAFAPVSALNALRRDALDRLTAARRTAFESRTNTACGKGTALSDSPGQVNSVTIAEPVPHTDEQSRVIGMETLAVCFTEASAGKDFLEAGANLLLYAPMDFTTHSLGAQLPLLPSGSWLMLPPQMSDAAFTQAIPVLLANRERIAGVVLGSVGQLGFSIPLPIALGEGVPVSNREAVQELLGNALSFFTLWPELNAGELATLLPHTRGVPALLTVYGRERLMLLNHCPERVMRGLTRGRENCALCHPGDRACASPDAAITDRRGYRFPLLRTRMPEGCVLELVNALPTDLAAQESRRRALGAGMRLRFTVEPLAEQLAITRRFAALLRTGEAHRSETPGTTGHFLRGVQ
jgi:putative protease